MFIPWYPINHNFASSIPIISDYPLTDALPQKKQVSESSPRSWEACGIFATQSVYLVGGFNPSEKYESQLGLLFPIYGKIKNVPNHFVPLCATHCLGSRRQHSCLWDTLQWTWRLRHWYGQSIKLPRLPTKGPYRKQLQPSVNCTKPLGTPGHHKATSKHTHHMVGRCAIARLHRNTSMMQDFSQHSQHLATKPLRVGSPNP